MVVSTVGEVPLLAIDASLLCHPAQADRLDVLSDILAPFRCVTTRVVHEEVGRRVSAAAAERVATAAWLEEARVDGLDDFELMIGWAARLGSGQHHRGEATVATVGERENCTVGCDDREARAIMRNFGLTVHGTLGFIADAIVRQSQHPNAFAGFIDALVATGARLPCSGSDFPAWARTNGLLPPA